MPWCLCFNSCPAVLSSLVVVLHVVHSGLLLVDDIRTPAATTCSCVVYCTSAWVPCSSYVWAMHDSTCGGYHQYLYREYFSILFMNHCSVDSTSTCLSDVVGRKEDGSMATL